MTIPPQYAVDDLNTALAKALFPTITVWNRLEGRPRTSNFDRALKAELRDPLWMLTKQWQTGEFAADDAGSPIFAKLQMRTTSITRYRAEGGAAEAFAEAVPLEAKAEQRALAWAWNGHKMRFDLRAQLGRHWRKLLGAAGLAAYFPKYLAAYPIVLPAKDADGDYLYAHRQGWQQIAALAGRAIDGGDLHLHLSDKDHPANKASDGIALADPADAAKLDALGAEFEAWFAKQYVQPAQDIAWKPSALEYQFACSAPQAGTEVALEAEEYGGGHLDWYAFDRAVPPGGLGGTAAPSMEQLAVLPFIPTPVNFEGMPDPRWWALEDRKTDFGGVKPSTTDLAQLLLMEFGLVYANNWFLVPYRIPAGTLARVEGLAVTNNFGERFWVIAAGTGALDNWHRWAMFQLAQENAGTAAADTSLLVPPATSSTLDGEPLEEIELGRDEVANMVWAVERTICAVAGTGRAGKDEARETRQYHEQLAGAGTPPDVPWRAPIYYSAMTGVPEHWIPFLPVHVPGSNRQIQLQRGRMLRLIDGDKTPPVKVPPRTTLVRQGLDQAPPLSYFVHEEEVPREGTSLSLAFRRTRWTGGEAYVWLGVRKETGRGERGSDLAFDSIVNAKT
jgi:hypothetical protein